MGQMTLSSPPHTGLDFEIGDIVLLEEVFKEDAFFVDRERLENWLYVLKTVPDICLISGTRCDGLMAELTPLFTSHGQQSPANMIYNFISVRITKL